MLFLQLKMNKLCLELKLNKEFMKVLNFKTKWTFSNFKSTNSIILLVLIFKFGKSYVTKSK